VKVLIISKAEAFKPDAAGWPAGTRFFQIDFSEKYIFLHIIFLFLQTIGQNRILKTILHSYGIRIRYVELF
jgi:hypothetical protein